MDERFANFDLFWMSYAYRLANLSPDPSNQNGAVIVDATGMPIAQGWNLILDGVAPANLKELIQDRDWKYDHIEHAERAAIYGLIGGHWEGHLTMYTPWAACPDCARAIVQAGISRVVVHGPRMEQTPERWYSSVSDGLLIMRQCGVRIDTLTGELPPVSITVNGEQWSPFEGAI